MTPRTSRLDALRQDLGERLSDRMFEQLSGETAGDESVRRRSPSFLLALVVATLVYLLGLMFALCGATLLIADWHSPWQVVGGIVLLMMGWLARPRLTPRPDTLLDTGDYPVLHRLLRSIAQRLASPAPAGIGVSTAFNASYRTSGWRGERYVELGLPLLAVLRPDELVALLAHELSHGANGDPLRGKFLHGAIHTLALWAEALRPTALGRAGAGHALGPILSLLALPMELALLALSELILLTARGLMLLVLRDSQRAEYLADRLASRVAGSAAMVGVLEALYQNDVIEAASRRHALTEPDAPLAPILRTARDGIDESQWAAWRQESFAAKWRADTSHPPTALRIAMLQRLDPAPHEPLLSDADRLALGVEIDRLLLKRQRYVVNEMLEAAYGG